VNAASTVPRAASATQGNPLDELLLELSERSQSARVRAWAGRLAEDGDAAASGRVIGQGARSKRAARRRESSSGV
jgi:hypothetical protein